MSQKMKEEKQREYRRENEYIYRYECIPISVCTHTFMRYTHILGVKATQQKDTTKGASEATTQYREVEIQKPAAQGWGKGRQQHGAFVFCYCFFFFFFLSMEPLDRPSSPRLRALELVSTAYNYSSIPQ